jgi:hypothetical protein
MKILLLAAALNAQEPAPTPPAPTLPAAPMVSSMSDSKSFMMIDPKVRANDYVQAFDLLRRDKPTLKIVLRTSSGMTYFNVTDLSITHGGTLFLVKFLSNQGSKTQILPVEEIVELAYSPA